MTVTAGATTLTPLNTVGIVHNSAAGLLSTGLIASADIGTGAVTSAAILDGTIVNADVAAAAAIAGTKISPNFGSQAVSTTGGYTTGNNTSLGTVVFGDGTNAFTGTLETAPLTASHVYQLPDRTGTFFATTSISSYTDIVLLQPSSIQQFANGTADGIAIQEGAGATGAFMVLYDQFTNPLYTIGNTGSLITSDYINISNTTNTSKIQGAVSGTTLQLNSSGGAGSLGLGVGTSGEPETGVIIESGASGAGSNTDLILQGPGQGTAFKLNGGGNLAQDITTAGGGYKSGINITAIGTTAGNFALKGFVSSNTTSAVDGVIGQITRQHANGASADYVVTPASTIADGGSPLMALGNADATHYSNGLTIKNGAFALAGTVQPAGHITGADANAANTTKTINNPLCTADAIIILTPANADAAKAQWYVASVADGSFVIENFAATASASASNVNYFIITPVSR